MAKNVEETEFAARSAKAGRYITEKNMDINKQKKASIKKTLEQEE